MTHVDGNAIAGLLEVLFGRDMTVSTGRCSGCGAERELGALYVYRAAGIVVRCPDCNLVLMRIVEAREQTWIDLSGLSTMRMRS